MIIINFGVTYVAVGLVHPENLVGLAQSPEPLLTMAARTVHISPFPPGSSLIIVTVAGIFAALASLTTALMVQSSIMLGLSRDGYLPKSLLSIHHRFKTPYIAILANSFFLIIFTGTGVVAFLAYAASFGSLLVFVLVNLSLMKLRKEKPYLKRPFKAPLYPVTPIAGIVTALLLMGIPVAFGEQNAESALMLAISLIILAVMTYHLRMVGYRSLRVAIGGMNLGVGGFIVLLFSLIMTDSVPLDFSLPLGLLLIWVLVFVCVISILAGILNVTVKSRH
jgi:APA family basic amino acid/polyamine antiporter